MNWEAGYNFWSVSAVTFWFPSFLFLLFGRAGHFLISSGKTALSTTQRMPRNKQHICFLPSGARQTCRPPGKEHLSTGPNRSGASVLKSDRRSVPRLAVTAALNASPLCISSRFINGLLLLFTSSRTFLLPHHRVFFSFVFL